MLGSRSVVWGLGLWALGLAAIAGCAKDIPSETSSSDPIGQYDSVTWLDQWGEAARRTYYWTSEGSRVIPVRWFLALEVEGGTQPFRGAENMSRLGYIPQRAMPGGGDLRGEMENPNEFPVGFAVDSNPGEKEPWVGFTCAACHTSQITYRGRTLRIDGGPSLGDMTLFLESLLGSLRETLRDDAKFQRFAVNAYGSAVDANTKSELRAEMETVTERLGAREERNRPPFPPGHARVDPVANIFNETICAPTNMPQNCRQPKAPMKMPHLWGITELEWVQANSLAHNPMPRNVSQSLGVFAETRVDATCPYPNTSGWFAPNALCEVRSSVRVRNMIALEASIAELKPPKWPSEIFGAINEDLAGRGAELYADRCERCHATTDVWSEPNKSGKRFIEVTSVPLAQIGTDPDMARAIVERRADPGPFRDRFKPEDFDDEGNVQALAMVSQAVAGALINSFRDEYSLGAPSNYVNLFNYRELTDNREIRLPTNEQMLAYKARPLHGVAFIGYLLHNGSVPNVYELLLPSAQRSRKFYVGNREFDAKRLGFVSDRAIEGVTTEFDASLPGNSNAGHEYGARMTEGERWALIEFLKTL